MSAAEHHEVERVATVTQLPSRAMPDPEPPAIVEPKSPLLPRAVAYWQPPDIWSEKRPSLRDLWMYGVYGRWTSTTGFARWAGTGYALLSMLGHAVGYTLLWIVERPARFLVAAIVAALIKLAF